MRLTLRAGTCEEGPCPTIYDTDDGRAAVQGEILTDADALAQLRGMPAHETVVLVPRQLLAEYARTIGERRG